MLAYLLYTQLKIYILIVYFISTNIVSIRWSTIVVLEKNLNPGINTNLNRENQSNCAAQEICLQLST